LTETTRIRDNKDVVSNDGLCFQTFDEILSKAGYRSEYYGKFHSPEYMAGVYTGEIPEDELKLKKLGQDDVHGVLDMPAEYTITAVQAREAIEALDRIKDQRFILTCSFHCPHVPITPSEPYVSMYNRGEMITPVSIHDSRSNSPYKPNQLKSPYSDPESVRVPFIICYPGKIKAGLLISTPVSVLNIFPTILDYAGIKNIPSDGYSLRPVIEGEPPRYDFAVSEWTWSNNNVPSLMIRTSDWKLMTTHRSGGKDVEALFDLKNDPFEMNNLLGTNPERFKYKEITENLHSKLVSYLKDVNSPLVKGVASRELIRK
jgi:arylsulfatase A-like enzyme